MICSYVHVLVHVLTHVLPCPFMYKALHVVEMIHSSHPSTPIYACGMDLRHAAELEHAGAIATVVTAGQGGLSLASRMLKTELGMATNDVEFIKDGLDQAMVARWVISTICSPAHV